MNLLNPRISPFDHLDINSKKMLHKVVDFFENRGKQKLKEDDHERAWYSDFLNFIKQEKLFYTFLTPSEYGDGTTRWDTYRNCALNEVLGFYGLCYWYTWQVTILGLGPIWMSENRDIKERTAAFLKNGRIFAFGLSEKEHGADIYSTSMSLHKEGGAFVANGSKYYIGNGNEAALVSVFGKMKDDYVFFAVDPENQNYECVKNICNSQNYVAEFKLNDYPVPEKNILSVGREAWDTSLNTVNVGKYNLGWASIGMCSHAFYEALNHASHRRLFDTYVTDFTHIKQNFVDAYARLTAMKMFALRASDYMRTASASDRRYLLYNPMVKMKVTTQGEEVIDLLWDVIAAKGFEKDMFFEMAARDIRALPKLEGTVHVNMALIIKFMKNYFFKPGKFPEIPLVDADKNDDFLFNQGPTKGLGKIQFHDYRPIYNKSNLANVKRFHKQVRWLKRFLFAGRPTKGQRKDFDFLLNLGELFTLVVYGQLILEKAEQEKTTEDILEQIFEIIIRDFSRFALQLYAKPSTSLIQKMLCKKMMRQPNHHPERFNRALEQVYELKDSYEMQL